MGVVIPAAAPLLEGAEPDDLDGRMSEFHAAHEAFALERTGVDHHEGTTFGEPDCSSGRQVAA